MTASPHASLELTVWDWDRMSGNDPIGKLALPLSALGAQDCEVWHKLLPMSSESPAAGARAQTATPGEGDAATTSELAPPNLLDPNLRNQLRVTLHRAAGLLVMDRKLIGKGSSDPFVKVQCDGAEAKSEVKLKTLAPEWDAETLALTVVGQGGEQGEGRQVVLRVYDYDKIGGNDFMGQVKLELRELLLRAGRSDSSESCELEPFAGQCTGNWSHLLNMFTGNGRDSGLAGQIRQG